MIYHSEWYVVIVISKQYSLWREMTMTILHWDDCIQVQKLFIQSSIYMPVSTIVILEAEAQEQQE